MSPQRHDAQAMLPMGAPSQRADLPNDVPNDDLLAEAGKRQEVESQILACTEYYDRSTMAIGDENVLRPSALAQYEDGNSGLRIPWIPRLRSWK
jgi:hypothetical protein